MWSAAACRRFHKLGSPGGGFQPGRAGWHNSSGFRRRSIAVREGTALPVPQELQRDAALAAEVEGYP
jgi:hypothetical protein